MQLQIPFFYGQNPLQFLPCFHVQVQFCNNPCFHDESGIFNAHEHGNFQLFFFFVMFLLWFEHGITTMLLY